MELDFHIYVLLGFRVHNLRGVAQVPKAYGDSEAEYPYPLIDIKWGGSKKFWEKLLGEKLTGSKILGKKSGKSVLDLSS